MSDGSMQAGIAAGAPAGPRQPLVVPQAPSAMATLRVFVQPLIHLALLLAVVLFFCDEVIRRALPGTPILVTAMKDGLLFGAGFLTLMITPGSRRVVSVLLPWSVYTFISSLYVLDQTGNWTHATGVWRTYTFAFLYMPVGYYLATQPSLKRSLGKLFLVGIGFAVVLAVLQEHMRAALPAFFSDRIYKASHSLAGGNYNEGPFASPTVLSVVLVTVLLFLTAEFARAERRIPRWWFALMLSMLYAVYLTRTRGAVVILVFGAALVLVAAPPSARVLRRWSQVAVVCLAVAAATGAALLLFGSDFRFGESSTQYDQDLAFYAWLLDKDELIQRLLMFGHELGFSEPNHVFFGHGTGLSGALSRLLTLPPNVPETHDTGLFLLYIEVGALGMVAFALTYVRAAGLCAVVGLRRAADASTRAAAVGVACITLWFLLKNHPLIANGATHALWLVMLGYVLAHAPISDVRIGDQRLPIHRPVGLERRASGPAIDQSA